MYNDKHASHKQRMKDYEQQFLGLFDTIVRVARAAKAFGGRIAFEWPTGNAWWQKNELKQFIREFSLTSVNFLGCPLGLTSADGHHILKPWTIVTNVKSIKEAFRHCLCNSNHYHAPCKGDDAKLSENYTDRMAAKIHTAWKHHVNMTVQRKGTTRAQRAAPSTILEELGVSSVEDLIPVDPSGKPLVPHGIGNTSADDCPDKLLDRVKAIKAELSTDKEFGSDSDSGGHTTAGNSSATEDNSDDTDWESIPEQVVTIKKPFDNGKCTSS